MFDVGLSEVVLIALLGLIVLGPKRLPEAARIAGQWMGKLRRFITDVKHDFGSELHNAELGDLYKLKNELEETRRMVQDTSSALLGQIDPSQGLNSAPTTTPSVESGYTAETATAPAKVTSKKKKRKKTSATRAKNGRARKAKRTKRT